MGNRSNVGLRQKDGQILFLYQHWTPEHFLAQVADAIQLVLNAGRAKDESYANKIFISDIDPSGILIDAIDDNEHKIPVVDFSQGTVDLFEEGKPLGKGIFTMFIDTFVDRYGTK